MDSRERDFALDSVVQPDTLDLDPGDDLQLLVALEPAGFERLAHGALDLTLGGDTHLLEELAHFDVDCVFFHHGLAGPQR